MINNGENEQDLYFYRQKCSGNEENFNKIKITEGGSANFIHSHVSYYQENTEFEFFIHKKLEENPLQIAFSPLGTYFFVSFKDYGYLYGILGQEIKEVFKVSMYCRACVFDESGTYLAFATSELENDFTINVYNVSTFEYEYMVTRVPSPTKLVFVDNSRILVAQFNDNSTNLIGWRLNWNKRLIKSNANGQKEKQEKEDDNVDIAIKISDFSGNIMDFVYDSSLDHCLITSADKRQRVDTGVVGTTNTEIGVTNAQSVVASGNECRCRSEQKREVLPRVALVELLASESGVIVSDLRYGRIDYNLIQLSGEGSGVSLRICNNTYRQCGGKNKVEFFHTSLAALPAQVQRV